MAINGKQKKVMTREESAIFESIPKDMNFLILEDEEQFSKQYVDFLKELNFTGNFFLAPDIASANEIIAKQSIHFILADWMLPDGSGLDFLKSVRKMRKYRKIPILMITSINDMSEILEAVSAGASSYLMKADLSCESLLERIVSSWKKELK